MSSQRADGERELERAQQALFISARYQLQALIQRRASDFSLAALLSVLSRLGYEDSQIELRSHVTSLHQPGLIASIEFPSSQTVVITLNYGLLATQSPLPGYVLEYIETQSRTTLVDFLEFLAHHLLRQVAAGQRSLLASSSSRRTATSTLCLLGRKSISTIHWLFGQVFPELDVGVRDGQQHIRIKSPGVQLGGIQFGDGASFGGYSSVLLPMVAVTLLAEESLSPFGNHWYFEACKRLRAFILPLLLDQHLYLSVTLQVRGADGWLRIGGKRELGVEPIRTASTASSEAGRRYPIFEGEVTESRCAALEGDHAEKRSSA